jgi:hypothetical protein
LASLPPLGVRASRPGGTLFVSLGATWVGANADFPMHDLVDPVGFGAIFPDIRRGGPGNPMRRGDDADGTAKTPGRQGV